MKIDRLMGILTVLLQNDKVTAPQLAERFEVSRRNPCERNFTLLSKIYAENIQAEKKHDI